MRCILSVPFHKTDGLKALFCQSRLTGDNQLYCDHCDDKADATMECKLGEHPEVLVLLLKRFVLDYHCMEYVKNDSLVDVPLNIDVPEADEDDEDDDDSGDEVHEVPGSGEGGKKTGDTEVSTNETKSHSEAGPSRFPPAGGRRLRPQGRRLRSQGRRLRPQGRRLRPQGRRLRPQGRRLRSQGRRLRPQGRRLRPQGRRLRPQGRRLRPQGRRLRPQGRRLRSQGRRLRPQGRGSAPQVGVPEDGGEDFGRGKIQKWPS
ncbi:hypothetical protein NHX12_014420 [Muraenolepis orangiensis]|uniref:Uncharacterized protein n=1 Tax=Muraenolepis orangiensis TaxID=630683 RepID=A0A9Q0I6T5_9TELE|nr:hypothetical protein NHX12_014420 [Muraenolepis orangiensis]